ncbi:MAG: tetratricopeptide repeat protein [Bryobacteraceae bacterium]|nr:tetratricopeptide repeat protein [Bryobacteraceae bacterium]
MIAVLNLDGDRAANVAALEAAFRRIYGVEREPPGEQDAARLRQMRDFPLRGGLDGWSKAKDAYLERVWRQLGESDDQLRSFLIGVFESQGLTRRVAEYREAAVAAKPGDGKLLMEWAVALQNDGRPGEGIPVMARLLRMAPDYPGGHTRLGILQALDGKKAPAEQSFRRALELQPDDVTARVNLGALVIEQLGRREEGMAHFREAAARHPEHEGARKNLALAIAARRGLEKKLEELKAAVAGKDGGGEYLRLGIAYARLGRMAEAAKALSEAVRREPGSPQARRNYATVALLQRDYGNARRAVEEMRRLGMAVDPAFAAALEGAAGISESQR